MARLLPRSGVRKLPLLAGIATVLLLAFAAFPGSAQGGGNPGGPNKAPVVVSVGLPGLVAPFSVTPNAGMPQSAPFLFVVRDVNGCNDIASVSVTIKNPSDGAVVSAAAASYVSCAGQVRATYAYNHTVSFHAAPGTYKVEVTATDSKGATGTNVLDITTFTVRELVAVKLGAGSISFGAGLEPGDTSATKTVTVQNHGNVVIDTQVSGTAMAHEGGQVSIPVGSVKWSLASDMTGSSGLSGSAVTASGFDLAKGASSTRPLYLSVDVPEAIPAGDYTGTLTLGAIKSA